MAEKVLPDNQLGDSQVMMAAQPSPQKTQEYPETLADVEDKEEEKGMQVAVAATPTPQRARSPPAQETKKQKPVEAMSWDDLQYMSNGHQYCQHCQMPVDVTTKTAVRKKTHKQVSCKQCHNTVTLLYRHYDMQKLQFKELPAHEACLLRNPEIVF